MSLDGGAVSLFAPRSFARPGLFPPGSPRELQRGIRPAPDDRFSLPPSPSAPARRPPSFRAEGSERPFRRCAPARRRALVHRGQQVGGDPRNLPLEDVRLFARVRLRCDPDLRPDLVLFSLPQKVNPRVQPVHLVCLRGRHEAVGLFSAGVDFPPARNSSTPLTMFLTPFKTSSKSLIGIFA